MIQLALSNVIFFLREPLAGPRQNNPCSFGLDDVAKSDLLFLVGPTCDNANHAVENELRLLPIYHCFYLLKALEFFLNLNCSLGSAWAIIGRGLRNLNPNCLNNL